MWVNINAVIASKPCRSTRPETDNLKRQNMFDLPKPKLVDISAITITAPDLEKSFAFYQTLGFKELYRVMRLFPGYKLLTEPC